MVAPLQPRRVDLVPGLGTCLSMLARDLVLRTAFAAGILGLLGSCTVGGGTNDGLSGSASSPLGDTSTASDAQSSDSGEASTADGGHTPTDGDPTGGDPTTAAASSESSVDSSGGSNDDAATADDSSTAVGEDSSTSGAPSDLDDGILDITIVSHDDCTFTTMPASISVPEGTEFTVNWISAATSDIEFDVAKIDQFNAVPIILGMEPATEYHDEVRVWCGALFTGTFDFRVTSCFDPHYIPVDCSA